MNTKVENKVPSVSSITAIAIFNTKFDAVQNKIPKGNCLVIKYIILLKSLRLREKYFTTSDLQVTYLMQR